MKTIIFCLALAMCVSPVSARQQPEETPPPPRQRAAPERRARPHDASAREGLSRRLERAEREQRVLRQALDMLDQGRSPEEAQRFVREQLDAEPRDGARRRGAAPGDRGGPERPRERGGDQGGPRRPAPAPEGDPLLDAPPPPPLPPERAMELLEEVHARIWERLRRLQREDEAEFQRVLRRVSPRLSELDRERQDRPQMWRLRSQSFRLHRQATDLARTINAQGIDHSQRELERLRAIAGEQVDLRLRLREEEVRHLSERIEHIRAQIGEAANQREAQVAQYMRDVLKQSREERDREPPPPTDGPRHDAE